MLWDIVQERKHHTKHAGKSVLSYFFLPHQNAKALKAKKDEGNQAFKKFNYEAAYQLYTEALAIDPNNIKTNAKLYCNRATAGAKVNIGFNIIIKWTKTFDKSDLIALPPKQLNKVNQTIEDCTSAIKLDDTYIKAYLRRAQR